jgi:hypothetical protein
MGVFLLKIHTYDYFYFSLLEIFHQIFRMRFVIVSDRKPNSYASSRREEIILLINEV